MSRNGSIRQPQATPTEPPAETRVVPMRDECEHGSLRRKCETCHVLAQAVELRRCLDSALGMLTATMELMPSGPSGFGLASLVEGGWGPMSDLIDEIVAGTGGPKRDDDERLEHSFYRGYQHAIVGRREQIDREYAGPSLSMHPREFFDLYCKGSDAQELNAEQAVDKFIRESVENTVAKGGA